jgi:hypothetical protein
MEMDRTKANSREKNDFIMKKPLYEFGDIPIVQRKGKYENQNNLSIA